MPEVERDHHRLNGISAGVTRGVATGITRATKTIEDRLIENPMTVAMTSPQRLREKLLLKKVAKSKFEIGCILLSIERHQLHCSSQY